MDQGPTRKLHSLNKLKQYNRRTLATPVNFILNKVTFSWCQVPYTMHKSHIVIPW